MKTEFQVRVLAGALVLLSLALAHFVNPWWLGLAAFVGVNLIQSAFTEFCLAASMLRWFAHGSGPPHDPGKPGPHA